MSIGIPPVSDSGETLGESTDIHLTTRDKETPLSWSSELPTEPGWYWIRERQHDSGGWSPAQMRHLARAGAGFGGRLSSEIPPSGFSTKAARMDTLYMQQAGMSPYYSQDEDSGFGSMLHTTLALLIKFNACRQRLPDGSYYKLLASLPIDHTEVLIPLDHILSVNGIDGALLALRACIEPHRDRVAREHACRSAERLLPIFESARPGDSRPRQAIETAYRYARGEVTDNELAAAGFAAREAARATGFIKKGLRSAKWAAEIAAWATGVYAWAIAGAAARAACEGIREAAGETACEAERENQVRDLLDLLRVPA